jgi:hypothetical protein
MKTVSMGFYSANNTLIHSLLHMQHAWHDDIKREKREQFRKEHM